MNRYKIRKMTKKQAHVLKLFVVRNIFCFGQFFFIVIVWLFLWSHSLVYVLINSPGCAKQRVLGRRQRDRRAVLVVMPTRNAALNFGCGKGKLAWKNGRLEAIERDNAQNLPASAFDRHSAEVRQSMEEIKVRF